MLLFFCGGRGDDPVWTIHGLHEALQQWFERCISVAMREANAALQMDQWQTALRALGSKLWMPPSTTGNVPFPYLGVWLQQGAPVRCGVLLQLT